MDVTDLTWKKSGTQVLTELSLTLSKHILYDVIEN